MIQLFIAVLVITATPPTSDEMENRKKRIADIHILARSDAPTDFESLSKIIAGGALWERHAALLALRPAHKGYLRKIVKGLIKDRNPALRTEACVLLYRWTSSRRALQRLKTLRALGTNLRRAFQVGERGGRPLYDKKAEAFFLESVRHKNLYTRLDGAMGLVELDAKGRGVAGIRIIESALADADPKVRLAAVNHLSVQYVEPAFRPLLVTASKDPDLSVSRAAQQILARN